MNIKIKTLLAFSVIIIIILLTLSMTACSLASYEHFNSGYFQCVDMGDSIKIIGLTDIGLELEEIVFPTEIYFKPVDGIQIDDTSGHGFVSEKAKKFFLPSSVRVISFVDLFGNPDEVRTLLISTVPIKSQVSKYGLAYVIVPKITFEAYLQYRTEAIDAANVTYYYNYSDSPNNGCHWIDYLNEGESIKTIPTAPVREGYAFSGWYTEEECINLFDFKTTKIVDIEIELYAKWIADIM
ncbi:MAG: InlB B-repeat-containing protein [Christensenellaceae bacterium]|jgi:uncharacterized repeat protein (TIGR02543 family)|nr:InlB B-repeat-containing protein [Christensenellaceae bacterium]